MHYSCILRIMKTANESIHGIGGGFTEPGICGAEEQEKGNGIVMRGYLEAKRSGRLSEDMFK